MQEMEPSQPRPGCIGVQVEDWIASQIVLRLRELISTHSLDTRMFDGALHSLYIGVRTPQELIDTAPMIIDDGGTVGRVNIVIRNPCAEGHAATLAICEILSGFGVNPDRAARGTGSDAKRRIFSLYRK